VGSSIVGVDVGGTSIRAVRFDDEMQPVATAGGSTPTGLDAIVGAVVTHIAAVSVDHAAIAVGVPGRVDAERGVVSSAVNLGIHAPVAFGELVASRLGRPVHVENDVNAAALGAFHHLGLPATASLAYVNVGTGIAAGIVLGGRLWRGATGTAGEIGHIPMWSHGPACACGQRGCAEAVGSGRAVDATPERRSDVVGVVAWAVQLCVMTLDVDVVALGGGMTESAAMVDEVRATLARREAASPMLSDLGLASRVVSAPVGVTLGSLGAALALAGRDAGPVSA
jgi:glucokinase